MRIFLCLAAFIVAVIMLTGCKKETAVTPAKTFKTAKIALGQDTTGFSGGDDSPKAPHKP